MVSSDSESDSSSKEMLFAADASQGRTQADVLNASLQPLDPESPLTPKPFYNASDLRGYANISSSQEAIPVPLNTANRVIHQESLMNSVYARMKETDFNSIADTLGPKWVNINESSGSQRQICRTNSTEAMVEGIPKPPRKTLCFTLSFSLRFTIASAFSMLLIVGLGAMISVTITFMYDVLRGYQLIYEDSVNTMKAGAARIIDSNSENFGRLTVRAFSLNVDANVINLPVQLVGSAWKFILSKNELPEIEISLGVGPLAFVYFQTLDFSAWVSKMYFAFLNESLYGYETMYATFAPNAQKRESYFVYATTRGVPVNSSATAQIYSCPITDSRGRADLERCTDMIEGMPFNTTFRPSFLAQSIQAKKTSIKHSVFLWTNLYQDETSAQAYALTWPINPCNNYTCFRGVLSADITTRVVSALCNISLIKSLVELQQYENTKKTKTPSAFYVLVRRKASYHPQIAIYDQSGWIVGAAINNATHSGPLDIQYNSPATSSKDPIIRSSSIFLRNFIGPFSDPLYDTPQFVRYNDVTLSRCTCLERNNGSGHCLTVATFPTGEYTGPGEFLIRNKIKWVSIIILPCFVFLEDFNDTLQEVRHDVIDQVSETREAISHQIIVEIVIAALLLFSTIFIALIMSYYVTRPLMRVKDSMISLRRFEFQKNDLMRFSRMKEISEIQRTFIALRRALYTFAKFVPSTVVESIVKGPEIAGRLHVLNKEVTIMFSDIENFTAISEKLEINDLLYLLTSYLTLMTRIIESYEGVVAEILGDGLLVFWNTPVDVDQHPAKALTTALACQEVIHTLFRQKFEDLLTINGLPAIRIRIGIHTGVVLTGNIGSETKMKFGCIGDPVNLASRLEGLCKLYGVEIICSEDTVARLPSREIFLLRELDLVQVKGKKIPDRIYEVLSQEVPIQEMIQKFPIPLDPFSRYQEAIGNGESHSSPKTHESKHLRNSLHWPRTKNSAQLQTRKKLGNVTQVVLYVKGESLNETFRQNVVIYEQALHEYQAGKFDRALELIKEIRPDNPASDYLKKRIQHARQTNGSRDSLVSKNWTGANILYEKEF